MACTVALAVADHEKDEPCATKILVTDLECRFHSLARNDPLASTSSPSNFIGMGLFVGLPSILSACFHLVCSTPDAAVGVAVGSGSTNSMGGV
jgi:hypothetical protein|tara:strand:- start:3007 stop:3285 length:279 start_codon:yes stop_codon:yes gene_type:complete